MESIFGKDISQATVLGYGIQGVLDAIADRPKLLDGFSRRDECRQIIALKPYPLSLYLDLADFLTLALSRAEMVQVGRAVGRAVLKEFLTRIDVHNAEDAIGALQKGHESYCMPVIGEFRVSEEAPNTLHLTYTAPYDCVIQEGLFMEIVAHYGHGEVNVEQIECRRNGAPACVYRLRL